MEISKRTIYSNGTIKNTIASKGLTIKQFSEHIGWKYQNLLNFINFNKFPRKENYDDLIKGLLELDKNIIIKDIVPEKFKILSEVFGNKNKTINIDENTLLEFHKQNYTNLIDNTDKPLDIVLIDRENKSILMDKINLILNSRQAFIIKKYFGIDCDKLTLASISNTIGISQARVGQHKDRALKKLLVNSWFRDHFKDVGFD